MKNESKGLIVSLFDYTGVVLEPWAEVGYECWSVDLQHQDVCGTQDDRGIWQFKGDIRTWRLPNREDLKMVFAWPPCTHLAVSGARWFKGKGLHALAEAISLVAHAADACDKSGVPYLIENPLSTLSSYWRAPDYIFDPCDYGGYLDPEGDKYTKKTCLWTGGGFKMPEGKYVEPTEGSRMHKLPPSAERANIRSATPEGFARAVFEANASLDDLIQKTFGFTKTT